MRHIVSFSTGLPSAIVAYLVCKEHPDALVVFADVKIEDSDNYRFYEDVEKLIGKKIIYLSGDKDPYEIADNEGYAYIPNQMTATCTQKGKIEILRAFAQAGDIMYIGMDLKDVKRRRNLQAPIDNWAKDGVTVKYPLIEQGIDPHELAKELGLVPPRMYALNYKHANCGGRCVKQGQYDWLITLQNFPDRYQLSELWEQKKRYMQMNRIYAEMALYLTINPIYLIWCKVAKLYTLVRRQRNGVNIGVTLEQLRLEYESKNKQLDFYSMLDELDGNNCTVDCGVGSPDELEKVFGK